MTIWGTVTLRGRWSRVAQLLERVDPTGHGVCRQRSSTAAQSGIVGMRARVRRRPTAPRRTVALRRAHESLICLPGPIQRSGCRLRDPARFRAALRAARRGPRTAPFGYLVSGPIPHPEKFCWKPLTRIWVAPRRAPVDTDVGRPRQGAAGDAPSYKEVHRAYQPEHCGIQRIPQSVRHQLAVGEVARETVLGLPDQPCRRRCVGPGEV
jgi:hypothetical protein